MSDMTFSRGARAAATKRNNQARKALPLFNDQVLGGMGLLTTAEEQQARLDKAHEFADRHLAALHEKQARQDAAVPVLRAWAERVMPGDVFAKTLVTVKACPENYAWAIWQEALGDYLGISRRESWQSLADFCGLERNGI